MGKRIPWICLLGFLTVFVSNRGFPAAPSLAIQAKDDLLTLKVTRAPLQEILNEIVKQAGIEITIHGELKGVLSAEFSNVPLEEGLKRLMKDLNYVLIYGPGKGKKGTSPILKVIVYAEENLRGEEPRMTRAMEPPPELSTRESSPERSEEESEAPFESLVSDLEDEDAEVREEAVDSLGEIQDERAVGHLSKALLDDQDADVRESAAMALESLRDEGAIGPLIQALRDPDPDVRESAIDALGAIGGEEVIQPLMRALKDEDEDVREAAALALKKLTGRDFGPQVSP